MRKLLFTVLALASFTLQAQDNEIIIKSSLSKDVSLKYEVEHAIHKSLTLLADH